jgi:RecB family endonuclease NucS
LEALTKPSLEEARELVERATREKLVVMLVGQCIVNYVGRAGSVLPQGAHRHHEARWHTARPPKG